MSNGFNAPEGASNKKDVALVPAGMHLCVLYTICDLGTQETNFGEKPQIKLIYEFPKEMRVFYEGEEPRPSVISITDSFFMSAKANLRKHVHGMIGRALRIL